MRFTDIHDDPATASAARRLDRTLRERNVARAERAAEERHTLPREWQEVTGMSQFLLYLTPDELKALDEEFTRVLLTRYADRRDGTAPRPEDARPVEILALAYVRPEAR
jgi:hypothetical protein